MENPEEFIRQALRKNDLTIPEGKEYVLSHLLLQLLPEQYFGNICDSLYNSDAYSHYHLRRGVMGNG